MKLAPEILKGSVRSLARLISWLEDNDERAYGEMRELFPHCGSAYVIGITGSPGAGKSTLTDKITYLFRRKGYSVGIIAVDPSSPFTGGAVLGDRVRMSRLNTDPGVFIRSMATRGHLGGVARATSDVVKVLDAFGKDIIIIETVGVGQDEIDIIKMVDTTLLVLVPGMGDVIQSMKAGVMEIADIFVVNKADHAGTEQLISEIKMRRDQDEKAKGYDWVPPVLSTIAVDGVGIEEVNGAINDHKSYLERSGKLSSNRRKRIKDETLNLVHFEIVKILRNRFITDGSFDEIVDQIVTGQKDPYTVACELVKDVVSQDAK